MSILPYREKPEEPSVRGQGALEAKVGKRTIPLFLCQKQSQKREGIVLIPVTFSLF